MENIVIIGAGQAGLQAAESLRSAGFAGGVTLLGDESTGPYHRPPLSKAWMAGEMDAAQLFIRSPEAIARKDIALRTDSRAVAIDRSAKVVRLVDGETLSYDGLVIATGATPRNLQFPGSAAINVRALRSRADADAIASAILACKDSGRRILIIGGGFIGLEVAATARKKGLDVTVLEAAPRLLGRVLAPSMSEWFADLHRSQGVDVRLNATITGFESDTGGAVKCVRLADGEVLAVGFVVVGVGVSANDELARAAGLACDRGVIVDECGQTEDPAIVAAGDCTARRLDDGGLLRLESVQNAIEQGKSAAAALLGDRRPFVAAPWFWSDQYDKKLQMAGLSMGADRWALRGEMTDDGFSVYHFRGDNLLAVDSVNAARDHMQARKLLDARVAPTKRQVSDKSFDLATLLIK